MNQDSKLMTNKDCVFRRQLYLAVWRLFGLPKWMYVRCRQWARGDEALCKH